MKFSLSSLRARLGLLLVAATLGLGLAGCHEEHRRVVHHGYYDDRRDHRDHYYDRDAGYRRGSYDSGPTVVVRPGRDRNYYGY